MEKAITEGWRFFLPAGTAAAVGAAIVYSTHPDVATSLWWNTLFSFGILLIVLATYGVLANFFPAIAPPPQMLQERLFWTAKRYRAFVVENSGVTEESFRRKFWRKYPFKGLDALAKRAGISGATVDWELFTALPTESVVQRIADHLERLTRYVPSNTPF